jgi:hypothetical protein
MLGQLLPDTMHFWANATILESQGEGGALSLSHRLLLYWWELSCFKSEYIVCSGALLLAFQLFSLLVWKGFGLLVWLLKIPSRTFYALC